MKDKDIRFPTSILKEASLHSMTIYNVLNEFDRDGVAFRLPSYQRQSVWTQDMEIRFMESVLLQLPIGIYVVDCVVVEEPYMELLDGQQRWRAILNYYQDKFAVFGLKYSELNVMERMVFHRTQFPRYETKNLPEADKKAIFTLLAYGGVPNNADDPTTLDKVM